MDYISLAASVITFTVLFIVLIGLVTNWTRSKFKSGLYDPYAESDEKRLSDKYFDKEERIKILKDAYGDSPYINDIILLEKQKTGERKKYQWGSGEVILDSTRMLGPDTYMDKDGNVVVKHHDAYLKNIPSEAAKKYAVRYFMNLDLGPAVPLAEQEVDADRIKGWPVTNTKNAMEMVTTEPLLY
jgi:hypothetical protein